MFSPSLSHLQLRPDPPMLEVYALGAGVLVAITLLHGAGLGYTVRSYRRAAQRLLQNASQPWRASLLFGCAILLMLILHTIDACIWALVLRSTGLVSDIRSSLYFTANSYTTLGYGNVPLGVGWRELSPIMAICGLFTFGWTTSVMFNVVGYHNDLLDELKDEYARKLRMRSNLRAEVRVIHRHESESEKAEEIAERKQEAGKTFFQRFRMRREERKKRYLLRDQATHEARDAFRKEREAEKDIYRPPDQTPKV